MNGRDITRDAWSKELREASLARRKGVKGELTLSAEPGMASAAEPAKPPPSGWTARIAAMLPTLRRVVLGAA